MKHWKKAVTSGVVIAIATMGLTLGGCGSDSDEADSAENQIVEVTQGNLMTTISSFGSISMPEQAELTFGSGQSANDLYTVSEINVKFGHVVKEGDILAKLDTASLERAVTQAESDLRTAQINLEQATSETNLLKAEAAVKSAEVSLARAEQELDEARNFNLSDAETDLEIAQRNLDTTQKNAVINITDAENNVDSAYQTYSSFVSENIEKLTIASVQAQADTFYWAYEKALKNREIAKSQAETSIANAEASVTVAQNALLNAPLEIQQKEATVASAQATLAQEQDDLAYMEAGYDVELLQLRVDNAQDDLDDALEQLEAAAIVAPFDGVVAAVNASVGDEVTPSDVIIHLVNTSVVEIDAAVDEIDVASVETGQMAMVVLDALPDAKLRGQVSAVSPVAASQSSVVTFDIAVAVQGADQYDLKEGMSATITIMAMDVQNALLVPSNAIQRTTNGNVVQVVGGDGQTEERAVEVGATNGQQTEIISGLTEGEQVVVQSSSGDMAEIIEQFQRGGRIPGMGGGGMRPPM
jgi:HlyD family secretion protein